MVFFCAFLVDGLLFFCIFADKMFGWVFVVCFDKFNLFHYKL